MRVRHEKKTTKIQCYPFFSRWMQNWEWSLMSKRFWIAFEENRLGKNPEQNLSDQNSYVRERISKILEVLFTHPDFLLSGYAAGKSRCNSTELGIFFSQVNAEFKLPRNCRWNQISVLKPTGTECFNCPECPAGQGLVPQCGSRITADVSVECVHCQTGEGYFYKRDISSCKPCTICDPNEQTISLCTASKNAVCGKCKSG